MFNFRSKTIRPLAIAFMLLGFAHQAVAQPWKDLAPAQLSDMPRWPLYAAGIVALVIGLLKTVHYFRSAKPKTKIFPKLSLRRRLSAPYSGGNHAEIAFGRRDA